MNYSQWSQLKKREKEREKKKYNSYAEWSNEQLGITEEEKDSALKQREDEIAPVKQEDPSWFQGGAFSDGYQFGDITKTIVGTVADINENINEAVFDATENLIDTGAYVVGAVGGLFDEDFQDEVGEFIAEEILTPKETGEAVATYATPFGWANLLVNGGETEENSVLGDKSDGLVQSASHLVGSYALQVVGVPTWLTMGVNAFGSEVESAFQQGATYGEAGVSAGISAAAEIVFEKISSGINIGGGGTLDDGVQQLLKNGISNKIGRTVAKVAVDAVGEASEEVLTEATTAVARKFTYMDDKEWSEVLSSEDLFDAAIGGAVLGSVANGVRIGKNASDGRDLTTGLTTSEEKVVRKLYEDAIADRPADAKRLTVREKEKLWDEIVERMDKGEISIDTIEEVLGGDDYKSYRNTIETEDALKSELDTLRNTEKGKLTDIQEERLAELKGMNLEDPTKRNEARSKLDNTLSPLLKDSRLMESYNERARKGQAFEADLTKYKGKQKDAVERAVKSGVLNNTRKSHELVNILSKIEADKGIVFDYADNAKLQESGFALEGKTINGFEHNGTVTLNVQSAKSWQSVVGHEITHVLEGTEAYDSLRKTLFEYAKKRGELDSRRTALTALYKNIDADIDAELTADLVGDYLFNDKQFIKDLITNRNLFQRIYDEIKYLCKVATGRQLNDVEEIRREFDKAWKELSLDSKAVSEATEGETESVKFSIREEAPPKETGIAYKVFFVKDGKLYPPMVANPDGADTPIGVWLNADVGTAAPPSKTGRAQVKAGGKGTQGGSGSLAFRPGWHLGDLPRASQFDRVNPETGKKELFPENFVWAEVEYAKDVDYQEEAMSYGYTENGKFRHAYAGLPKLPENGYYRYRTNPKPDTVPWVITGAMKVNRLLSDAEVNEILEKNGVPAVHRQGGDVGLDKFGFEESGKVKYSVSTDSEGNQLSKEQSEYFKDSKVVDENGNLKVMYHGSPNAGFHEFNAKFSDDGTSFFFVDRNDMAESYSGTNEEYIAKTFNTAEDFNNFFAEIGAEDYEVIEENGQFVLLDDGDEVATSDTAKGLYDEFTDYTGLGWGAANYKTYLNITNPLVVDAQGKDWNRLPDPRDIDGNDGLTSEFGFEMFTTRDYAEYAKEKGYNGVIFKNIYDKGGYASANESATVAIAFESNQIKSVANTNPTADKDIRYSLSSMANTFYGDESMSSVAFERSDYKQTDGYKNYVEQCVNNMRQTRADFDETVARQEIEEQIDGIVQVALAAKRAGYDIVDDASKRDVKDSKNRLLFSSLEPNSDYFTSSDISTICDKRKNFAEIYDEIVRAEEAKGVPKGKRFFDNVDNYFALHKILADKGLTQPCRECYVESMRKNLAPMANAFLKLVNETDVNNKANDQLYQPSGKNKGKLKSSNAELRQRVLETFEEHPEYGMTASDLTVKMLTTENGLAELKIKAPLIYEAFNSFYGQSKPKMPKSATPFRFGELTALLTDHNGKIKQSLVDKINSTGGFRLQSYSDFQIQNYTDVLQVIFEAGTLGLNGHAYTKVPAFLEATEGTNLKRNISIFMYKDGNEWKLDKNDSFPAESLEEIYDIVKADKSGNTGIIAVSQNKDMSCWIMANDNVAYGIPFHKSGLKMGTVRDTDVKTDDGRIIKGYSGTIDHTKQQTEVWAKATEDHKALTKVKKGIDIYEFWDFDNKSNLPKNKLIEKNVKKYIDACEKAGYLPKFRDYVMNNGAVLESVLNYSKELGFVSQDATIEDISFKYKGYTIPYGYYKFLGDFSMFTPDGKASPHDTLSLKNYDFDKASNFFADAEGLRRNEILQQFANDGERQKYRDSDLNAEQLTEIIKQKRQEVADSIVAPVKNSLSFEGEQPSTTGTPLQDLYLAPTQEDVSQMETAETVEENIEAPFPDEISPMTEEEANALQDEKAKADAKLEGEPKTRKQLHSNIINDIKATFSSDGYDFDDVLSKAKNLSTFSTVDNTPQRVMEKALGYKEGQKLADLTVNKVAQNETEGIKWLNSFTDRKNGLLAQISKEYHIKPGSKESAAAQMYAEGFYVAENNDIVAYGDDELEVDFPNENVRWNIKGLASDPRIRQIYDETLDAINKSRTRNAYPEIQKLDNYFLHFRAMDDTFSRLGLPFNPNDIKAKDLPTDLNGVTADLKPGQPYFASAMHRKGKRTSFDLLGGLERYLTSAKNQIYHIDDIQTLRALRNYIADTYGQANGLEGIDALTEEEAQERIEKVYDSHLSTFAKFLNEEANILAGKTALIDRGLEGVIGRRGMTFLDTVRKQVGSNMVGYNISSSLTNFLPVVQTFAKSNKFDFFKAFTQTVSNKIGHIFGKGDSFAENSPVMIRRNGADRFYRTPFQKVGDAGYFLMGAVDNISTEIIARTKFNELTRKGMSEQQAHFETDKWVSRLMGDRSLGQMPQLYNSKTLGFITQFQLEVRNQLDSQFYDTIQEAKVSNEDIQNGLARNAKIAAKVTSTFVQLAVAQHLFGKAFESIAGYNPAFDIIEVLATMFGFDDEEDSEDTALDNIEQGFLALLEDLPYTSSFTGGGRIPISSALPVTEVITGEDSYGNEKPRLETIGEALPYYVLPGGYGQIKKTSQGLGMFSDEHPVAGSYTDSGNLRFPVEDTFGNRVKAGIFGQYANENAREYFDNDYAPLKEKQIQEYIDVEMPISDYWKYRKGLAKQEELEDKFNYINDLDLPIEKKNILINNVVNRKEEVDMSNYGDYDSLEEFDYATKNPDKYALAKSVGGYSAYKTYSKNLYNIKADKDAYGKSISGSRKEKVLNYINQLDADYETKLILFKSEYPSDDTYNWDIINYINNRADLSYEERVAIYTELGFTVKDGYIYWD